MFNSAVKEHYIAELTVVTPWQMDLVYQATQWLAYKNRPIQPNELLIVEPFNFMHGNSGGMFFHIYIVERVI